MKLTRYNQSIKLTPITKSGKSNLRGLMKEFTNVRWSGGKMTITGEFFVKRDFNTIYRNLSDMYIKKYGMAYGEQFKQFRVKDRVITDAANVSNFVEAQLYLQSTEAIILKYI